MNLIWRPTHGKPFGLGGPRRSLWCCMESHISLTHAGSGYYSIDDRRCHYECGSWAELLSHEILFHHPELATRLMRWGFLDADYDGGDAYWRLDFWNGNMRRLWRQFEAERAAQAHTRWVR